MSDESASQITSTPMLDELRALAETWRKMAKNPRRTSLSSARTLIVCASDLLAALDSDGTIEVLVEGP